MRIAFDVYGSGLGNNGGSRTIVKSANALTDLGHEVFVFSHCDNFFTWTPLKGEHISLPDEAQAFSFPKVDAVIATASPTSFHAYELSKRQKALSAYWIRGIEFWSKPLEYLAKTYRIPWNVLMVNSGWQKKYVDEFKPPTGVQIQYPGLEIDLFVPGCRRPFVEVPVIGGIYSIPRKRHKNFDEWVMILGNLSVMSDRKIKSALLTHEYLDDLARYCADEQCVSPNEKEKRDFYRGIDIWLATTNLDGLHLPPMEAALCGAALVGNGVWTSGMSDHAVHGETALLYSGVQNAVECVRYLMGNPEYTANLAENHRRLLVEKMGTRESQMGRMVKRFEDAG